MGIDTHPAQETKAPASAFAGSKQEPAISPALHDMLRHPGADQPSPPLASPSSQAAAPQKAFGKMTDNEKAKSLAQVMENSAGTLQANGVSHRSQELLAGVMMNEGGTNTRRVTLTNYFNEMMTGEKKGNKGKSDGGLVGQIDKAGGIEKLNGDPEALAKFQKGLSEDQRFMVTRALSGQLDLAGLKSDDKERKAAAQDQMTNAGVDLRSQQYDEMSALHARQKSGEKLSPEEQNRLKQLGNISGRAMGYDRLDRRNGADASMADTRGLSSGRFREIYEDSQVRFEPAHYKKWRDQYEQQSEANAQLPADKQKPITMKSSVDSYTVQDRDKESLSRNRDMLADFTTSYGTAQVMGVYAHAGKLNAKDAQGKPIDFDVERLKAASRRKNPNEEDVQLLIGELASKEKKTNLASNELSTETITTKYNGAQGQNANWNDYNRKLKQNVSTYQSAEKARAADKRRPPAGPNANYAE